MGKIVEVGELQAEKEGGGKGFTIFRIGSRFDVCVVCGLAEVWVC